MDISSLNLTIPSPQNHQTTKPPKTLPPGPPRLPLIGNLHQFLFAGDLPTYLWKLSKKHGSIIHLKLGSISAIVVSSPKLAKQVLKIQDSSFCSRPTFLGQQKLSYNNMDMGFSPYGDYWREMRKMTSIHLLSAGKIQSFRPIREEEVSLMIANIGKICDGEREGGVVDLSEMALSLGSSLICRIAFGRGHEDEESKKERRFGESLREAQGVLASLCVSDFFPWLSWVDRLNGYRDWIDATYEKLDVFYQEIIDDHLDPKRKSENENEEDIVDILIKLKEEKSLSVHIVRVEYIHRGNRYKRGGHSLGDDGVDEGTSNHEQTTTRNPKSGWKKRPRRRRRSPSTSIPKSSHKRDIPIVSSDPTAHATSNAKIHSTRLSNRAQDSDLCQRVGSCKRSRVLGRSRQVCAREVLGYRH
ncbi:6,7,8-trihydroxycoumarin synthase-like isoform X3 [Salvia hispanica]|uniref:6,7,8-trihydroxycoumarin synthase-like isoform X3 n=1 Tax=Salvia hispanica TaxID=49212 RepID=UPI0020096A37|nr:6,7,8-trihydroxycoumarin synthase-like isoform X3 [Salvia hispanica]